MPFRVSRRMSGLTQAAALRRYADGRFPYIIQRAEPKIPLPGGTRRALPERGGAALVQRRYGQGGDTEHLWGPRPVAPGFIKIAHALCVPVGRSLPVEKVHYLRFYGCGKPPRPEDSRFLYLHVRQLWVLRGPLAWPLENANPMCFCSACHIIRTPETPPAGALAGRRFLGLSDKTQNGFL